MSHTAFSTPLLAFRFPFPVSVYVHWTPGLISILSHCEELLVRLSFTAYWLVSRWPTVCYPLQWIHASFPVSVDPRPSSSLSCNSEFRGADSLFVEPLRLSQCYSYVLSVKPCLVPCVWAIFTFPTLQPLPSRASLSTLGPFTTNSIPMPCCSPSSLTSPILFAQRLRHQPGAPSCVQSFPTFPSPWQPSRPCVRLLGWYRTLPPWCNLTSPPYSHVSWSLSSRISSFYSFFWRSCIQHAFLVCR